MSERLVTAVVLFDPHARAEQIEATFTAIAAQTRAADRLVAVTPGAIPEAVEDAIARQDEAGRIDELLRTPSTVGTAGAIRDVLDLLSAEPARSDTPSADASSADEAVPRSPRSAQRHARQVDHDEVQKRLVREAGSLARVPERLREKDDTVGSRTAGRRRARTDDDSWLWLLTADSVPGRDALAAQLRAAEESPTTAVVGSKRLGRRDVEEAGDADAADLLVDVGLTLTHSARVVTGIDAGEVDQGQADWREDVFAVAMPGMLVREQTLAHLDGLDPALPSPWAEIELCHRVWRSGERVAVAANSRVLAPTAIASDHELLREQRRGQMLTLLTLRGFPLALLTLLLTPVMTLLRVLGRIAGHRPRLAWAEVRALLDTWVRAPRVLGRTLRGRRRTPVPRGRLAPLYLPRGEAARGRFDALWTRLFADDERSRRIRRTTWGIAGTTHGTDDADYGRHGVWTMVLALVATVIGVIAVRPLLGRGTLDGPLFARLPVDRAEAWAASWAGWIPEGLGHRGPADPLVRLLVPALGPGFLEALLLLAIPLAALGAWWAAGAITRAVGARFVLAVAWAVAPPLIAALRDGAWPLLLVHLLLPLLALTIGHAIGLVHKVSQASVSAAAAGGLVLLVIGAVQPVLVLLAGLALVLLAPFVPGRRRRLLWFVVPSLALHLPYLPMYIGHPSTLLHVAGVPAPTNPPTTTELLAGWPTSAPEWTWLTPLLGQQGAQLAPLLIMVPLALAALAAPLITGNAGRAGRLALLVAATGSGLAVVIRAVPTEIAADALRAAPLHGVLSVSLLALALGAAATFDTLARPATVTWRRVTSVAAAVVVAAVAVVGVGGWALAMPGTLEVHRAGADQVPQAARDLGTSDTRGRVLTMTSDEDDVTAAQLVVSGGPNILQTSGIADARNLATVRAGGEIDTDPASEALRTAAGGLLTSAPAASDTALRTLAIGYVVVPDPQDEGRSLAGALDTSPQLEKVTENETSGLWRVVDAGPRVSIRAEDDGADESETVPSDLVDATGHVDAEDSPRTVVLAERADSQWTAHIGDQELEPTTVDGWAQGFELPAGSAGELTIQRDDSLRLPAQILLGAVLVISVLVALPWRSRVRPGSGKEETWQRPLL